MTTSDDFEEPWTMRRFLFLLACGLFASGLGSSAQASVIISGNHTYDVGKTVELSGLEWLAWTDPLTGPETVVNVAAQFGSGGALEGWRYATRGEFESLFDSLWGGTVEADHTSNYLGAKWLRDNFVVGAANPNFSVAFGLGEAGPGKIYRGFSRVNTTDPKTGYFSDLVGLSTGASPDNVQSVFEANAFNFDGHALVRSTSSSTAATVPEPGSLAVMGIGVLGMIAGGRRRRRAAPAALPAV